MNGLLLIVRVVYSIVRLRLSVLSRAMKAACMRVGTMLWTRWSRLRPFLSLSSCLSLKVWLKRLVTRNPQ